jgi:porin
MIAVHGPVFPIVGGRCARDQQHPGTEPPPSLRSLGALAGKRPAPLAIATKIGLIDVNTEFDVQSVGALFVHASHGTGAELAQSGPNGPGIFPMAMSGALVTASTAGKLTVRLGAFDAQAGSVSNDRMPAFRLPGTTGALLIGEVEVPLGQGELQLGVWRYTRAMPRVDDDTRNARSHGAYAGRAAGAALARLGAAGAGRRAQQPDQCYLGTGLVREAGAWQWAWPWPMPAWAAAPAPRCAPMAWPAPTKPRLNSPPPGR